MSRRIFPSEWDEQDSVLLMWPNENTDWEEILDEAVQCFVNIAREISKRQRLIIITNDRQKTSNDLSSIEERSNLLIIEADYNDTWARDCSALSIFENGNPTILDFGFNAWGLKFASNYDNLLTEKLFSMGIFNDQVRRSDHRNFILEGGSVESNGNGVLLTTETCLLADNRNQPLSKSEIESKLKDYFGISDVLWLKHGHLEGDDTDAHIDTLARFCSERTIAYVSCDDPSDEHYDDLKKMEDELSRFTTPDGDHYCLLALPMADPIYDGNFRLPATYANFLIINSAVLLPFYGSEKDELAKGVLQRAFPDREIVGIDCRALIKQHGSLHCVTMQFPKGFISSDFNN